MKSEDEAKVKWPMASKAGYKKGMLMDQHMSRVRNALCKLTNCSVSK